MQYVCAILLFIASTVAAVPIDRATLIKVLDVAQSKRVPVSVAYWQHIEESGNRFTGGLGDPDAVGDKDRRFTSDGLFQLNTDPDNMRFLLENFWDEPVENFDIKDPIDNAIVAMGYMRWLHDKFGSWYIAAARFNCGPNRPTIPESSLAYAFRIIHAREPKL
jgi:hypothetical protein